LAEKPFHPRRGFISPDSRQRSDEVTGVFTLCVAKVLQEAAVIDFQIKQVNIVEYTLGWRETAVTAGCFFIRE
jgi:hypothetical protein